MNTCQESLKGPADHSVDRKLRIFIADDHAVVREGLMAILNGEDDMEVVGMAVNGDDALREWLRCRPDVALIDLRMPVKSGVEAITSIKEADPGARLVILTVYDGDDHVYRGLRAGALAYLLKDAPASEILTCIRCVYDGKRYVSSSLADKLVSGLLDDNLTSRELQVLKLIAKGSSNKIVAAQLNIGEGTVKSHVNSVLKKLDATSRTEAVAIALRKGIVEI